MSRSFADLGVHSALLDVLTGLEIIDPTPIQSATLPDALAGRDVLGRGRTGSGKTYAFCLPLVTRLADTTPAGGRRTRNAPRGLILAPTRELARQIEETLAPLAKARGLTTTVIFGGVSQGRQVAALDRGVDIVVACPGRLEDLMGQKHCRMDSIEVTVLDEADHMADLGFLPGVTRILAATPKGAQRLLFSATLDQGVDTLVKKFLREPVVHSVDDGSATSGPTAHHVMQVDADDRVRALADLAGSTDRTVMFTRTKHGAKRLAKQLSGRGVTSVDLHGNLSQNARIRNLDAFSSGTASVLVATDIAARGIHVDDVGLVVHADPPAEHKAYVHRSGRTARAGAVGTVVTVATSDQVREVRSLLRAAGVTAGEFTLAVGADVADALANAPEAPEHMPADDGHGQPSQGQRRQGQNRQRQGRPAGGQGRGGQGGQRQSREGQGSRGQGGQGQGRDGGQGRPAGGGSERGGRDQQPAGAGGGRRRHPQSTGAQSSTRQGSSTRGTGAQRSSSVQQSVGGGSQPHGGQRRRSSRAAG